MEENKEYYAFISHKREDKKEAKRLQHALEYIRQAQHKYHCLLNHLRQEKTELPKFVRHVFLEIQAKTAENYSHKTSKIRL